MNPCSPSALPFQPGSQNDATPGITSAIPSAIPSAMSSSLTLAAPQQDGASSQPKGKTVDVSSSHAVAPSTDMTVVPESQRNENKISPPDDGLLQRSLSRMSAKLHDFQSSIPPALHGSIEEKQPDPEKCQLQEVDDAPSPTVTYPDGGWRAWSVVAGGWMMSFCAFGMISSFGAYQTYYFNELLPSYSVSAIAWIGSTASCLTFFFSTFGGSLFDRFGARKLLLGGSIVMVVGYLLLSFCKEYWQIFLCQGVLIPLGMSISLVCPVAVTNHWFLKRKGFAVGIVMSGASGGAISWPLVINHLPSKIGFAWTMRVICLMIGVLLFSGTLLLKTRLPPKPTGPVFHLQAFTQNRPYLFCALSSWFFSFGFFFFMFYIGQYAFQLGLGDKGNYLLIVANAGSGFGRVTSGWIADRAGRFNCMSVGSAIAAITLLVWIKCTTFPALVVVSLVFGIATGGNISLQPVCTAQVTPDQRLVGTMIGQLWGFQASALLLGPPVSGVILGYDSTQLLARFKYGIILNGLCLFVSAGFAIGAKLYQDKRWFVRI